MSRKRSASTPSPAAPAPAYVRALERPKFWIVGGANGSGKSSVYANLEIEDTGGAVWIINPDVLTARIQLTESRDLRDANLQAAERIFACLQASINAYQTIGVETVLSTAKYRPLVLAARAKHFEIRLVYVVLRSAELNVERVALRVRQGGHDVPRDKIIARRERSLQQLPWFLAHADRAWVIDNSTSPIEIARKDGDEIFLAADALPEIKDAVEAASAVTLETVDISS